MQLFNLKILQIMQTSMNYIIFLLRINYEFFDMKQYYIKIFYYLIYQKKKFKQNNLTVRGGVARLQAKTQERKIKAIRNRAKPELRPYRTVCTAFEVYGSLTMRLKIRFQFSFLNLRAKTELDKKFKDCCKFTKKNKLYLLKKSIGNRE
eukprot:TRINITY_DN42163_c0_g1_i1.p2 TRINITY_DN42163_c0_g1~~TRINITY_DN42163_c0_g1_i1.p2  ORF type:complete len:149 (+),score=1.00 TRINITY_DN42163_c0_g1_i1:553-999(+)